MYRPSSQKQCGPNCARQGTNPQVQIPLSSETQEVFLNCSTQFSLWMSFHVQGLKSKQRETSHRVATELDNTRHRWRRIAVPIAEWRIQLCSHHVWCSNARSPSSRCNSPRRPSHVWLTADPHGTPRTDERTDRVDGRMDGWTDGEMANKMCYVSSESGTLVHISIKINVLHSSSLLQYQHVFQSQRRENLLLCYLNLYTNYII